jgi:ABC-2 type transport system ATP-binding protein
MIPAIRCTGLVKRYEGRPPVEAVRGLDLTVHEGECFGLLGPNGAGKSTTIEIIEGLVEATAGEVEVLGRRWGEDDAAIKERIGISLQETRLPEKLLVREIITLFRSFYRNGLEPDEVIRRVSMEEKAQARVGKLSGGQRQRLAVACALVGDPELLLLDEPTTGLDPQSRRQLWELIHDFRGRGRTVLLTTHYMDEAERLCDRVAVVDHGKVIALGTPRELIAGLGGEHIIEFTLTEETASAAPAAPLEPATAAQLADLPAVRSVRREADRYCLSVTEPHVALPALLDRLRQSGHELAGLSTRHASLEDVFVTLTGRHLRDGDPSP